MPVRVQEEDFDVGAEIAILRQGRPDIGAAASFIGLVRDSNDGSPVSEMFLEHYPGMTEKALDAIVSEARGRWDVFDVLVVHRVGPLRPRDQIVLVAAVGAHRGEAFAACEFVMDFLKTRAPFWKREQTPEGPRWVDARVSDDAAAARWGASAGAVPEVSQAADAIAANRLRRARLAHLPEGLRPRDEASAYAVQDALHERLEGALGVLVGHKIGCTTPVMQAYLGIANPCAGMIFSSQAFTSGLHVPIDRFVRPGIECEIAIRLAADLPARARAYTRDDVAAAVDSIIPAIEIVDDRYDDYRSFDTPTLIADDFFNAGCVLGQPLRDWRTIDLTALEGVTRINGREAGRGRSSAVMGHPFDALVWLANMRSRSGRGLRRGEFVLTGSVVETRWVEPGDRVDIDIDRLGGVQVSFVPAGSAA